MLLQTLSWRRHSRDHFQELKSYATVCREMIFWCCNIFCVIPTSLQGIISRYTMLLCHARLVSFLFYFFFFFFLSLLLRCFFIFPSWNESRSVFAAYLHPPSITCIECTTCRPSTRFSANDIVITMSWEYWLRVWNAYPK